jgi:RNA polymerase sigma-70 factor (ECF subfamily)
MKPSQLEAQLERLHSESFGWALSCCGSDETEAEDVLQTTYLKIVTGKARFGGKSSFRTWVFGVIRRTAQEVSRRKQEERRRTIRLVPDELGAASREDPDRVLDRAEAARSLTEAMKRLSDRQREVLHLVFYQDLTIADAADVMGVSIGSARTHYERGKARLRELLKEDENVA